MNRRTYCRPIPWRLTILLAIPIGLGYASPALAQTAVCDAETHSTDVCRCDVRLLHPLQGALGMEEVTDKKKKIAEKPDKEWRKLEADPIKVIRGPGGGLYITDHHHGADAWRLANYPNALCHVADRPAPPVDADFWSGLIKDGLVHLFDAKGREIAPRATST